MKSHVDKLDFDKLKIILSGLNSFKSNLDDLDVDKVVTVPISLSKLSGIVKNEVVKKNVFDELVNAIDIIEISGLVKKTIYDAKINEIKGETPSITGLVTTALSTVRDDIPNVSDLVKKKIMMQNYEILKRKYFISSDYKIFTNEILGAKIKNKKIVIESDISEFIKNISLVEMIKKAK